MLSCRISRLALTRFMSSIPLNIPPGSHHVLQSTIPEEDTPSDNDQPKPREADPWASIFANLPSDPPPHSRCSTKLGRRRNERLHSSFFTSGAMKSGSRRGYSTSSVSGSNEASTSASPPPPKSPRELRPSSSIFDKSESPWDHVFKDITSMPPLLPSTVRSPKRDNPSASPSSPSSARGRRHTMTAREITAFDEMFNMIFNAVSEHKVQKTDAKYGDVDPSTVPGIGRGGSAKSGNMLDLFGRLRKQSKKVEWTTAEDEELDRKKEEMDLCDTDQQLLEWAMKEVFEESRKYEERARKAIAEAMSPTPASLLDSSSEQTLASKREPKALPMLQPPAYPHLLALLIRTFRDKYSDPHLALSMFDHARHLSIASYVFGCTTPAYNELIQTRWSCFRDLKGVCEALEEMKVNGVEPDSRTRSLVEGLRREVGERNMWEEESGVGSGEVWEMLNKIEGLVARKERKSKIRRLGGGGERSVRVQSFGGAKKQMKDWDSWKNPLRREGEDEWKFGQWEDGEQLDEGGFMSRGRRDVL
ncbi:hypothetical protein JAAARDRAFT_63903 [Jaapia argillacea MUCL 33604]|uniref:Mtf2-like C-terminal domain-containing protein n=1 Tax=Jaapia argillacea MUCL 33604 TaxID=933084 RepID=A0A067QMS3_9AGAM|nr:hypothetical protein JAAARDRAFT_63903 [Jaapia argillacea MUCL 33604]